MRARVFLLFMSAKKKNEHTNNNEKSNQFGVIELSLQHEAHIISMHRIELHSEIIDFDGNWVYIWEFHSINQPAKKCFNARISFDCFACVWIVEIYRRRLNKRENSQLLFVCFCVSWISIHTHRTESRKKYSTDRMNSK